MSELPADHDEGGAYLPIDQEIRPVRECRNTIPHPPHVTAYRSGDEWIEALCPGLDTPTDAPPPGFAVEQGASTAVTTPHRQDTSIAPSDRAREARELAERVFTPEQQAGLHVLPNRAERRRASRSMPASDVAWFCTTLDGKVHVVQAVGGKPKRTTICGRHALALAPDASTKKNRCESCSRVLA